jgi:deoxycytidine triphosphate deaminase
MPAAKKAAARAAAPAKKAAAKKPAASVAAAKLDQADKPAKGDKADKARKPKLVRDSFTIPKNEYTVLEDLKLRAAKLGRPVKKSEVLRAGVMALAGMGDAAFLASVTSVPAVKTGRPAKSAA